LSGEEKDKDNEFIQFKKFFQRIHKGTDCLYTNWVSLINDNNKRFAKASPPINNVYIYKNSHRAWGELRSFLLAVVLSEYGRHNACFSRNSFTK
jgi:hypothetical protein